MVEFTELITRARNGDAAALADLVRHYEPDVRVVARLRLGAALRPYVDSMDLVQSVHRSIFRGLQDRRLAPDEPGQLIALALTMVRRKAARIWRKQRRQQRLDTPVALGELLANLSSHDNAETPEYRDTVARLDRELDPLEKQVLELHLLGYRTAEIARLLKKDADSLRVKVSRMRVKLRSLPITGDV